MPLTVLGSEAQLEQVFLNLLVHAEQSLKDASEKTITVDTRPLAQRALIEISFSAPPTPGDETDPFLDSGRPESANFGLPVCRGIIQSHGGAIRLRRDPDNGSRFEVELPLAPVATREQEELRHRRQRAAVQLTVLLVEPDPAAQRQLITALSARGHRVVPANGAGAAVDLAQRLQFDFACSSTSLPGANWVELYERIRHLVSGFVLLTDGYNADISRAFQSSDSFVLSKPIDESEFDRLLSSIQALRARKPLHSR
jgi:CheY-like chemotaxis protein